DDVYLDDAALQTKLQRAHRHNGFHLIGVAGCLEPTIQHPSLWHLMAPRHQLRGSVQYFHNNDESRGCVFYGPSPSPADLLDGLFLAVHVPSALATGWRFNERFRFHHYDLAASLDAHRHGMRTGVAPIQLIHASPGLGNLEDPEWKPSDLLFRQLYAPSPA
ncbi:MAG: hypothetical protein RLZZ244_2670, partial [Verrucomicrobiota bacterium]